MNINYQNLYIIFIYNLRIISYFLWPFDFNLVTGITSHKIITAPWGSVCADVPTCFKINHSATAGVVLAYALSSTLYKGIGWPPPQLLQRDKNRIKFVKSWHRFRVNLVAIWATGYFLLELLDLISFWVVNGVTIFLNIIFSYQSGLFNRHFRPFFNFFTAQKCLIAIWGQICDYKFQKMTPLNIFIFQTGRVYGKLVKFICWKVLNLLTPGAWVAGIEN